MVELQRPSTYIKEEEKKEEKNREKREDASCLVFRGENVLLFSWAIC